MKNFIFLMASMLALCAATAISALTFPNPSAVAPMNIAQAISENSSFSNSDVLRLSAASLKSEFAAYVSAKAIAKPPSTARHWRI